ncbi:Hypothetical predicted protein [Pelobates cultripes]|uniref:Uncharacterized protein n=1 Tax=Pelobates cultripes TaxID=61616 RepID=A0AAD1SXS4_PELCU|nr:Hypothetical predicted protein [Pelobates cultripes]
MRSEQLVRAPVSTNNLLYQMGTHHQPPKVPSLDICLPSTHAAHEPGWASGQSHLHRDSTLPPPTTPPPPSHPLPAATLRTLTSEIHTINLSAAPISTCTPCSSSSQLRGGVVLDKILTSPDIKKKYHYGISADYPQSVVSRDPITHCLYSQIPLLTVCTQQISHHLLPVLTDPITNSLYSQIPSLTACTHRSQHLLSVLSRYSITYCLYSQIPSLTTVSTQQRSHH